MFDTIKFRLNTYDTHKALSVLEDAREHVDDGVITATTGKVRNMKARVNEYGISLNGSLAKFYFGNNLVSLTRKDTQRAIEELSDTLSLPMNDASIHRIDTAHNFFMKYPVPVYTSKFGGAPYFKKDTYSDKQGILYKNGSRAMTIYDKLKDAQRHKETIPELFQKRNVLRYENRHTKRLRQQFKRPITASMLYDEEFYINLINRWKTGYFSIFKINEKGLGLTMKGTKQLDKSLAFLGIQSIGGGEILFEEIKNRQLKGEIDKTQAMRLRKRVEELLSNPCIVKESEEIKELDKKVRQAVEYYR